jgi:hypothetical protein
MDSTGPLGIIIAVLMLIVVVFMSIVVPLATLYFARGTYKIVKGR